MSPSKYSFPLLIHCSQRFFPVLERVMELVLRDGAKAPCPIFFYLFYRLKSATFQWGFQLWEQEQVRRGQIWRVGRLENNSCFMLRQKFTDKEWSVSWCIVMVQHPGVVCPRLRPLPSHCHPQTDLGSSSMDVLHDLKRWYHSWHCVRLKQSSP